jgi:hypothetical protein
MTAWFRVKSEHSNRLSYASASVAFSGFGPWRQAQAEPGHLASVHAI